MNVYMYILIYISICMHEIWKVYMQTYGLVKIYQKIMLGDTKWISVWNIERTKRRLWVLLMLYFTRIQIACTFLSVVVAP